MNGNNKIQTITVNPVSLFAVVKTQNHIVSGASGGIVSKVDNCLRGRPEGFLFSSYYTEV